MNKKIIISNYDDIKNPFYGGGGAYVVHEIAKRLTAEFDLVVVTGKTPDSKNEVIDEVKYERIGMASAGPKLGQLIFYFMLFFYIKLNSFDLWMESFTPPFSTNFLQLFTKKPVIGLVYMLVGEDMKRKYRLPFDLIEKIGIKTYKYFVTPTRSAKEKILQINPNASVRLIPNGTNFRKGEKKQHYPKRNILYMGRIEINQKGLDLLLEAFSYIKDKTDYDLLIAGSGSRGDLRELARLIKKLKIETRVKLLGRVSGQVKENLFFNSGFIVIPSRFETFSIVALESLSYGLPIISFDIEGLRWMPKDSRIIIEPSNAKALSEAMLTLSKNHKQREKMSKIGRQYAKVNTWDNVAKKYSKYVKYLLYKTG